MAAPAAVGVAAVKLSAALVAEPLSVRLAGAKIQLAPEGRPVQAKVTTLSKPPSGVSVSVVTAEVVPRVTVIAVLFSIRVKLPIEVAVRVNGRTADSLAS